jgi:hypothetical protein
MFSATSRYANADTTTVTTRRGVTLAALRLPIRVRPAVRVVHPRSEGQRLDQIAYHYLADATGFWRLCDASDAIVPDALAARDRIEVSDGEVAG